MAMERDAVRSLTFCMEPANWGIAMAMAIPAITTIRSNSMRVKADCRVSREQLLDDVIVALNPVFAERLQIVELFAP